MIEQLATKLRDAGLDPDGEGLADALWLARYLDASVADGAEKGVGDAGTEDSASRDGDAARTGRQSTLSPAPDPRAELRLPPEKSAPDGEAVPGLPFRAPTGPGLPGTLAIGRALRPLMRRIPSRTVQELDEEATVQRIAEEGDWLPVLGPVRERWLDLALVIDEAPSLALWSRTVAEFQRLLERLGAFRSLRVYGLCWDRDSQTPQLRAGERRVNPGELLDPVGRRLIMVVSDAVAPPWRDGRVARLLERWTDHGPVVLVQLLPERFWPRTGLGAGMVVSFRAHEPGVANTLLEQRSFRQRLARFSNRQASGVSPAGPKLPVVTLEPDFLNAWSQALASGGLWVPGVVLSREPGESSGDRRPTPPPLGAEERVERFLASASREAALLAGYLASAPLSLPVMRLVQRVMVPEPRQVHLAEVFLSGLIKREKPEEEGLAADSVRYVFVDGVREQLRATTPKSDQLEVLYAVSRFVEQRIGQPLDFLAWVSGRKSLHVDDATSEAWRVFATVTVDVLKNLGGRYAALADSLAEGARYRVTSDGNTRVTSDGSRRVTSEYSTYFLKNGDPLITKDGESYLVRADLQSAADTGDSTEDFDVMVLYARPDSLSASHLAERLRAEGLRVWFDQWMIIPGEDLAEQVMQAAKASRCQILLISPETLASETDAENLDWIAAQARDSDEQRFVSLVLGDCELPSWVTLRKFIDYRDANEEGFQELLRYCKAESVDIPASAYGDDGNRMPFVHGLQTREVKLLQEQVARQLGLPVAFQDHLSDDSLGPEMLVIPPGRFLMGSPEDEPGRHERERQHEVSIERPFAIGRYAVTFAEYDRFCEAIERKAPEDEGWGRDRRPVINVSWEDALAYCQWLSKQTGQEYRLPTEAEWEYACRAGTNTAYWWGAEISPKLANYGGKNKQTLSVDTFEPNPWGLYQVHGNVWEWTGSDWTEEYDGSELIASKNRAAGRVVRGGGWYNEPARVRSAFRDRNYARVAGNGRGFRLARAF